MPTTLPESLAEKIIAEKIHEWEVSKATARKARDRETLELHPFLALTRDFGCGEEKLIPLFEKTLNWKVYGRNLLDHIASRDALSRTFIESLDEHRINLLDDWVKFLIHSGAILQNDYIVKISKLMKVIASHESAIFLGRGVQYILADKPEGLFVNLTAPFDYRVARIAALRKLPEKEAETMVRTTDQERREYIARHFKKEREAPYDFDVTFNTMKVSEETICETIVALLKTKNPVPA